MSPIILAATTLAVTPAPTLPPDKVPNVDVTPGVAGFIAIAAVAVLTILLIVDMTRRIRRTRYRAEIRERLEAEARGEVLPPGEEQRSALGDLLAEYDADGTRRTGLDAPDIRYGGSSDSGRTDVRDDTERG